jgi:hypothetical protein
VGYEELINRPDGGSQERIVLMQAACYTHLTITLIYDDQLDVVPLHSL